MPSLPSEFESSPSASRPGRPHSLNDPPPNVPSLNGLSLDGPGLDPDDWPRFRELAHRMLDRMIDRFQSLDRERVWTPPPASLVERWKNDPVPWHGSGEAVALEDFCRDILPYGNGSFHPRFLGWVQGTGLPMGMLADMLASGLNSHLAGFETAPKWVELQVIRWIAEMLTQPVHESGLLTTGGSMANLLALQVARHARLTSCPDIGKQGHAADRSLTIYASDQTHGWLSKAMPLLGFDSNVLRSIPAQRDGTMDVDLLKTRIIEDRRHGLTPWCLIANVGTVNTGAIDPIDGMAELACEFGMWLHVDGAFGAWAALLPEYRSRLMGLGKADSLAVDLHKWFYLPFDIGCMLIRSQQYHLDTFASAQPYMLETDRGLLAGGVPLADRGVELTRSFRALKAWLCLRAYGVNRFAQCIQTNVEQARYLARRIDEHPCLERLADVPLNIVCFRYRPFRDAGEELAPERGLDELNQEILLRLQESGVAVLSSTRIHGRFALRAALTNHRTRRSDLDRILRTIVELGQKTSGAETRSGDWPQDQSSQPAESE